MKAIDKARAAFEAAAFRFDKARFEDRLVAQKLVYLAQELDVELGYRDTFNFYLRGTYSPTLAKDLFDSAAQGGVVEAALSEKETNVLARLARSTRLKPHILEVMAAYRFLRKEGMDYEEAIRVLKTHKPFIGARDVAIGVSKSKTLWPEVQSEDHESLQVEMEPWDRASA